MRLVPLLAVLVAGCTQDVGLIDNPRCDGIKQRGEDTVDAPFDRDGDGFVDGGNPDCQNVYAAAVLDCDDGEAEVNPQRTEITCDGLDNDCNPETPDAEDADEDGVDVCEDCDDDDPDRSPDQTEQTCNGIDDDCDETTPDALDADSDGVTACDDCNDNNGDMFPGNTETCDGIDNDCNGEVDEVCADWTGSWTLSPVATYQCADYFGTGSYLVNVNLRRLTVVHADATLTMNSGSSQPGQMSGTVNQDGVFSVTRTVTGSCDETYTISGTFTDADTFEGTFSADYTGALCLDCTYQEWSVTGTR